MKAIIYHNPRCKKSQYALEYLEAHKVEVDIRPYLEVGITRSELYDILELLDCNIVDIVRRDDITLLDKCSPIIASSKESYINAIVERPILLQRPIVLFRSKAIGSMVRSVESLDLLLKNIGIAPIKLNKID